MSFMRTCDKVLITLDQQRNCILISFSYAICNVLQLAHIKVLIVKFYIKIKY